MTDRNSPPLAAAANDRRRASVAGQTFNDLFGRSNSVSGPSQGTAAYPGPITSAAAQAQRRRLSLTTIGLTGSPSQTSPFGGIRPRGESVSSTNSGSVDESPFEDDTTPPSAASNPTTPFARRLSFGARALRDVRANGSGSGGNSNGRASVHRTYSPPTAKSRGDGFNFGETLRSRAERSSISSSSRPMMGSMNQGGPHQRARSITAMDQPAREMPKQPKVPDAFQERILKGDFYMD